MKVLAAICCAAFVGLAPGAAYAEDYVVDTGAGTSSSGLILSGNPGVLDWTQSWHAGLFTLDATTDISSIEAWMTVSTAGEMTAAIYDADDGLPRASPALFSSTFTLSTGGPFFDWHGVSGLDWRLGPGSYWLNLEPAHTSTFQGALWMVPPDPLAHYAESIRGDTWEYDPAGRNGLDQWALRIGGTAVPEPSAWTLAIFGFGFAGAALRRRRIEHLRARAA